MRPLVQLRLPQLRQGVIVPIGAYCYLLMKRTTDGPDAKIGCLNE